MVKGEGVFSNKCNYSFALKGDEKPLELIRITSLGYVSSQFSLLLIMVFILTLSIPLILGDVSSLFLISWVVIMSVIFGGIFYLLTGTFRSQQTLVENIESEGIAVSADILKCEKVLQHAESLLEEIPYFLVTFSYRFSGKNEDEIRIANVPAQLFEELQKKQYVQIRFHKSDLNTGILESDMQRYLATHGKGLYD